MGEMTIYWRHGNQNHDNIGFVDSCRAHTDKQKNKSFADNKFTCYPLLVGYAGLGPRQNVLIYGQAIGVKINSNQKSFTLYK